MSVNFKPDTSPASWKTAERLAEEYDVYLGIHNHGGRHWLGSTEILNHVYSKIQEAASDSASTLLGLSTREKTPSKMAERYSDRLYGVHIKDFVFDRARNPEDVVVGQGSLNLPKLVELISVNETVQMTVLEYEGDVSNPVPALKECVEAVHALC